MVGLAGIHDSRAVGPSGFSENRFPMPIERKRLLSICLLRFASEPMILILFHSLAWQEQAIVDRLRFDGINE